MERDILMIEQTVCIDRGLCRESCAFGVVVCAATRKHHYEILPDPCQ